MYFRRMKNRCLYFLILLIGFGCSKSKNETLLLNGNDWKFAEYNAFVPEEVVQWETATVPGSVQTDLLNLGKIPDPFLLNNEDSIQWVSKRDWVYKKVFSLSSEKLKKKHHILKFKGLDTYTQVYLNDSLLLEADNAFRIWEIPISGLLTSENTLQLIFKSSDNFEKEKALRLPYQLPEAPRVFTRKPQFQYGWDWGPTIKTMGAWRDISLISYDVARLDDVYLETKDISEKKATILAHIEIESGEYTNQMEIEIVNTVSGKSVTQPVELYGGIGSYKVPIAINNPKLWWTHNLGEPYLYDFSIRLKKGSTIIDEVSKKVGLRTIKLISEKDSIGESFYFKLNGKPVYMKGANYIPQNIFLSEVTPSQREKLLNDAVEANMNMLRVWGGGVYEDDLFYDLCDEKGILLWQDFMFACAMYPGDTDFLDNVKQEAVDNVKRLRQHPSIALWCGNNENSEGWHRWGWQEGKTEEQKTEIWNNYQEVFNQILPTVVDNLSPSISYWESSPKYGRGDKRYKFEGDAHDWWVWHDGYPFEHYEEKVPRFMSEFGFQSFPSYEAIRYFTQQDSIDISHKSFTTHQKHNRGFQLIKEYMARDFPVPTTSEDYIYISQLVQAYGITKGILAHRRAKTYNMGTLYWQLNDCWPVVSWSSIDGLGNWKALHYKAKKAFEDRKIIAWEEDESLKVTIVDDGLNSNSGDLIVLFKSFNGDIIETFEKNSVVTSNYKNKTLLELDLSKLNFNSKRTYAEMFFGNLRSVYYFEKPKNLDLADKNLTVEMVKKEYGFEIRLNSDWLQKDVFLFSKSEGKFNRNFIDVFPSKTEIIKFKTTQKKPEIYFNSLNSLGYRGNVKLIFDVKF